MSNRSIALPLRRTAARVRAVDRSIAVLAVMAFVMSIGVAVMLPLLPLYAISLGATPSVLGLMVSAFSVALAVGMLASGFLTERFASRRLIIYGIGVYAVANIGIALSGAAAFLIGFRGIAGLGSGVAQLAQRLYITQVVDRARLAFANGVVSAAGAAGSVAGPAIGGLLAATGDLRLPFIAVGVTSLLATFAGWFLPVPASRAPAAEVPGVPEAPDAPAAKDWRGLSVRVLVALFMAQLAFEAAFGAFISTYAPFATERLGWSTAELGLVFSVFGLGSVLLGPWLARMADRRGRRVFGIIGALLVLPFAVAYVAELPRVVLYPLTVLAGAGFTCFEASWFALLAAATDDGRRGRVYGLVVALSTLGLMVGSLIATQAWERSGDVGLGFVVIAAALAVAAGALIAHPADRPFRLRPEPLPPPLPG